MKLASDTFAGLIMFVIIVAVASVAATTVCVYKQGCTGVPKAFQNTPIDVEYYK